MSANWRIGKVEEVRIGEDGYVRQAVIAYKDTTGDDPSDWVHRSVERPVRNIVKLFHIDETSLMEDIQAVHELSKKFLEKEKMSFDENQEEISPKPDGMEIFDVEDEEEMFDARLDVIEDDDFQEDEVLVEEIPLPELKKKRKTEVEKLKIDLKGWDMVTKIDEMKSLDPNTLQAVQLSAAPFIHNFMSATYVSTTVRTCPGYDANNDERVYCNMGLELGKVAEIEEEHFEVINDDNEFTRTGRL